MIAGQEVEDFVYEQEQIVGVKTKEGREIKADLVVLAMGAWSEAMLESTELKLPKGLVTAAGQCVATLQLNEEMRARYADLSVVMDTACGFYIFPVRVHACLSIHATLTDASSRQLKVKSSAHCTSRVILDAKKGRKLRYQSLMAQRRKKKLRSRKKNLQRFERDCGNTILNWPSWMCLPLGCAGAL